MSQVYPWDRGTNYAVEIGRKAAAHAIGVAPGQYAAPRVRRFRTRTWCQHVSPPRGQLPCVDSSPTDHPNVE